jgi:hypothetical protein
MKCVQNLKLKYDYYCYDFIYKWFYYINYVLEERVCTNVILHTCIRTRKLFFKKYTNWIKESLCKSTFMTYIMFFYYHGTCSFLLLCVIISRVNTNTKLWLIMSGRARRLYLLRIDYDIIKWLIKQLRTLLYRKQL